MSASKTFPRSFVHRVQASRLRRQLGRGMCASGVPSLWPPSHRGPLQPIVTGKVQIIKLGCESLRTCWLTVAVPLIVLQLCFPHKIRSLCESNSSICGSVTNHYVSLVGSPAIVDVNLISRDQLPVRLGGLLLCYRPIQSSPYTSQFGRLGPQ
jgi:hypothetical protein